MKKILLIAACLLIVIPVINAAGKTADELYLSGLDKSQQGKYAAAIKDFDAALALDPKMDRALYEKGNALAYSGDNQAALAAFNEAKKLNPADVKYMAAAGAAYRVEKKYKEALDNIDMAIKYDSEYADAWVLKSLTLFDMGNTEAARWSADMALESDPELPDAWTVKKDILLAMGEHEQALTYFEKLTAAYPGKAGHLLGKADVLIILERYSEALDGVAKALKIEPKSEQGLLKKGFLLHVMGYNFESVDCYDSMLKRKIGNKARVEALQGKAAALLSLEKQDAAEECLKEAEQLEAKIKA